jgi:tetratricopeptide (TPR) repeat protein
MKELNNFIQSPHNDLAVFHLANWYYDNGQYAAAVSFYLRVTECSKNDLLIYESLLKCGLCFEKQGNRISYAKGMYLHAISLLPMKAEAYFLLSRIYERNREWQESYSTAEIGLLMCNFDVAELQSVEYPGKWGFLFEKSVVSWWMGRIDECKTLSQQLLGMNIDDIHRTAVNNNLSMIFNNN